MATAINKIIIATVIKIRIAFMFISSSIMSLLNKCFYFFSRLCGINFFSFFPALNKALHFNIADCTSLWIKLQGKIALSTAVHSFLLKHPFQLLRHLFHCPPENSKNRQILLVLTVFVCYYRTNFVDEYKN